MSLSRKLLNFLNLTTSFPFLTLHAPRPLPQLKWCTKIRKTCKQQKNFSSKIISFHILKVLDTGPNLHVALLYAYGTDGCIICVATWKKKSQHCQKNKNLLWVGALRLYSKFTQTYRTKKPTTMAGCSLPLPHCITVLNFFQSDIICFKELKDIKAQFGSLLYYAHGMRKMTWHNSLYLQ